MEKSAGPRGSQESQPPDSAAHQPERVETYSGYRLHECPRYFTFQGKRLEVTRVAARWQEPEKLAFIVVAENSRQYLLSYDQSQDVWEIQVYPGSEPESA